MKNTYSGYSVDITTEPAFYGSVLTEAETIALASRLSDMVEEEFPGIFVYFSHDDCRTICGPDKSVREQIHVWLENNWLAAV